MGNGKEQGSLPGPEQKPYGELGRYQRLFNAVLPNPQRPIPLDRVQEVIAATERIIEGLSPAEKGVLQTRFIQQKVMTLGEAKHELGLNRERIRKTQAKSIEKLSQLKALGRYELLKESSIARSYLGLDFIGDVGFGFMIDQEKLPKEDQAVLRNALYSYYPGLEAVDTEPFEAKISLVTVTEPAIENTGFFASKISKRGKTIIANQLMSHLKAEDTGERKIILSDPNRLLGIVIPRDVASKISQFGIGEAGVIMAHRARELLLATGKKTLGDLLALSPSDLVKIKKFGAQRAFELGDFFQQVLDPKGEKYESGFLGEDLEKAYFAAQEEQSPPR